MKYPLPFILASLKRRAAVFVKLNLHSDYNLIQIQKGGECKFSSVTPSGHYEYRRFMNSLFHEYLHHFFLVYISDILVYSQNQTKHHHHVGLVLEKLREHQLFLVPSD